MFKDTTKQPCRKGDTDGYMDMGKINMATCLLDNSAVEDGDNATDEDGLYTSLYRSTEVNKEEMKYLPDANLYSDSSVYPIIVMETDGSEKCKLTVGQEGLYEMHIGPKDLCLVLTANHEIKYAWPHTYIRRYGRTPSPFTFEAGRKCDSGEGLFNFKVNDGELAFNEVDMMTKAIVKARVEKETKAREIQIATMPSSYFSIPMQSLPPIHNSSPVVETTSPTASPEHPPQLSVKGNLDTMEELETRQKKQPPIADLNKASSPVTFTTIHKPQVPPKPSHAAKEDPALKVLSDMHLLKLANKMGSEWKMIGGFLGIKNSEIKELSAEHGAEPKYAAWCMLVAWRDSADESEQDKIQALKGALLDVDREDIADML